MLGFHSLEVEGDVAVEKSHVCPTDMPVVWCLTDIYPSLVVEFPPFTCAVCKTAIEVVIKIVMALSSS